MRYVKNIFQKLLPGILFLLFAIGCASSSNTQRYGQNKPQKEEPKKNVRFTSEDTKTNDSKENNQLIVENPADTSEEEFDELPVEENPIDKTNFVSKIDKLKAFDVPLTSREKILFEVIKFLDTPYKYGGNTNNGIDCSGFTKQVFMESISMELPRSAREQYGVGEKISKDDLKFGDLVFFNTRRRSNPGHVGIYLGDNQFVHASLTLGVTVSSLDETYYKKRFVGARRIEEDSGSSNN